MQSAAMRRHSNAYFREKSDSDTADLLETQTLDRCTASRVLSVVYATEKSRENNGSAHPRDDGIAQATAQMVAAHSQVERLLRRQEFARRAQQRPSSFGAAVSKPCAL
jgi:hypothetical protein